MITAVPVASGGSAGRRPQAVEEVETAAERPGEQQIASISVSTMPSPPHASV
jgi:hypothetical protein